MQVTPPPAPAPNEAPAPPADPLESYGRHTAALAARAPAAVADRNFAAWARAYRGDLAPLWRFYVGRLARAGLAPGIDFPAFVYLTWLCSGRPGGRR